MDEDVAAAFAAWALDAGLNDYNKFDLAQEAFEAGWTAYQSSLTEGV